MHDSAEHPTRVAPGVGATTETRKGKARNARVVRWVLAMAVATVLSGHAVDGRVTRPADAITCQGPGPCLTKLHQCLGGCLDAASECLEGADGAIGAAATFEQHVAAAQQLFGCSTGLGECGVGCVTASLLPTTKPDLVPHIESCNPLTIRVENRGQADAGPSTTRLSVLFTVPIPRDIPTPPIPAGGSVEIASLLPSFFCRPTCRLALTVMADIHNQVDEDDEGNNTDTKLCQ